MSIQSSDAIFPLAFQSDLENFRYSGGHQDQKGEDLCSGGGSGGGFREKEPQAQAVCPAFHDAGQRFGMKHAPGFTGNNEKDSSGKNCQNPIEIKR